MNAIVNFVLLSLLAMATAFVVTLLLSLPVMWLWNWLVPPLFHGPEIVWLQAWGLSWLCRLLVGASGGQSNKKSDKVG